MLDKSKTNVVYLEGSDDDHGDDEDVPIDSAQYSLYTNKFGNWFLLLVECPEFRSIEIAIPLPNECSLKEGDVLRGAAYDESKGGCLTNMYYYTHFGIEDVIVAVGPIAPESAVFMVSGTLEAAPGELETATFTATAIRNDKLRKSFA
jgi:hypothetical protein